MTELVREFDDPVSDGAGAAYLVQVRGTERRDKKWEGRIAFLPVTGGEELMTSRESLQSDYNDLRYWATGLSRNFLESALARLRADNWPNAGSAADVRKIQLHADDDRVAELMGTYGLTPGVARDLPGGSRLTYESTSYTGSDRREHTFALALGDDAAATASFLSAYLSGARMRVDGEAVALDEHDLTVALTSPVRVSAPVPVS